ncbi:hypothetical protein, partial [Pseudonocardia sp. KRD291]|uniref:hypothetical protein n=1 Tax=Pseudonocardia sp. KRD291 TaxID=2792007 RepID=UPI001C49D250
MAGVVSRPSRGRSARRLRGGCSSDRPPSGVVRAVAGREVLERAVVEREPVEREPAERPGAGRSDAGSGTRSDGDSAVTAGSRRTGGSTGSGASS